MKFGRIGYKYIYKDSKSLKAFANHNFGDMIQTFAIDNLYRKMRIKNCDIITLEYSELKHYDGEYVILPMAFPGVGYKFFSTLPTSKKIIPVFISFELGTEECDDLIPYLSSYQPIGCRDDRTTDILRRKGLKAYTSGCFTVTLPKRDGIPIEKKTFLVDISSDLKSFIPEELISNCEYITHEVPIQNYPVIEKERISIENDARNILAKYKNEATLVVTSRLHAALPCIAMGIPVILAIDNIDERFTFLDKLIPLYDRYDYDKIDWNPKAIDIEPLKQQMFHIFEKAINKAVEENEDIYNLSAFWEDRKKANYNRELTLKLSALKERYHKNDCFDFIIWGAGIHGTLAYTITKKEFPNANLVAVVDKYKNGTFHEVKIVRADDLNNVAFDYAFITTHPGRFEAKDKLEHLGLKHIQDYCYFISKDVPEIQK